MACFRKIFSNLGEVRSVVTSPWLRVYSCSSIISNGSHRRYISTGKYAQCKLQDGEQELLKQYKQAMSKVPQPVIVVTTALRQPESGRWMKRGVTCISFTSVSLNPPVISFCLARHSRMHELLKKTQYFAVHVLARNQVSQGMHFSKPAIDDVCQFESVPHTMEKNGEPVIRDALAVLLCKSSSVHAVGDHHVWYGEVHKVQATGNMDEALLYFFRSFRSLGDEIFLKAFEDATLPFKDWTHEAHLRMAWNYIQEHGKQGAVPFIRQGIQKFNEQNKDKISIGYHETITMFFIHIIADAIERGRGMAVTFEQFMEMNPHLTDSTLMFQYYNKETIANPDAKYRFFLPDKKALP